MGRYQAYSEYKDSGIAWIGQVPEQWEVSQAKHHFVLQRGHDLASDEMVEGEFPVYGSNGQIGTHAEFTTKAPCLTVGRSGSVGEINYITKDFWAHNTSLYVKDFKGSPPRYIYYLLIALNPKRLSAGSAVGTLDRNNIHTQIIASPSNREAELIANFLDHETAKIDTLIEQQQQLIQLLKEKRQAVISHAVTKGLNPNAPMKDSGVEWLGEVPDGWEVKPLKFVISDKKGAVKAGPFGSHLKNSDMEGIDVKVISQKNIIAKDFDIGEFMISKEKYRELAVFTIERNDILITTRGTIGRAAIYLSDDIAILHPCLIRIQVDLSRVFPEFIALLIEESGYVLEQILINSNSTTIEVIYSENLINTIVCLPRNLQEQKGILNYVRQKKEYFDSSIIKAQQAIELMKERRSALISAAVTGKIDVRSWQSPQN